MGSTHGILPGAVDFSLLRVYFIQESFEEVLKICEICTIKEVLGFGVRVSVSTKAAAYG